MAGIPRNCRIEAGWSTEALKLRLSRKIIAARSLMSTGMHGNSQLRIAGGKFWPEFSRIAGLTSVTGASAEGSYKRHRLLASGFIASVLDRQQVTQNCSESPRHRWKHQRRPDTYYAALWTPGRDTSQADTSVSKMVAIAVTTTHANMDGSSAVIGSVSSYNKRRSPATP